MRFGLVLIFLTIGLFIENVCGQTERSQKSDYFKISEGEVC